MKKNLTQSIKLEKILQFGNVEKVNNGYKFTYFDYTDKDFVSIMYSNTDIKQFINRLYKEINLTI
jgi:predicted RNA-binding protein associated with RNAse of E/G family